MSFVGKKHSIETIERMRKIKTGKHQTIETKNKLRLLRLGKNNPFYGKHHSDATCKRISENHVDVSNDKNPQWRGDGASYVAIHHWVARHKDKPSFCEMCGEKEPYDLSNVSGEYKRDVNDYQWVCRKCHQVSDGRYERLKNSIWIERLR